MPIPLPLLPHRELSSIAKSSILKSITLSKTASYASCPTSTPHGHSSKTTPPPFILPNSLRTPRWSTGGVAEATTCCSRSRSAHGSQPSSLTTPTVFHFRVVSGLKNKFLHVSELYIKFDICLLRSARSPGAMFSMRPLVGPVTGSSQLRCSVAVVARR